MSIIKLAAVTMRTHAQTQVRSMTLITFMKVFLQQGNGESPVRSR